MPWIGEYEDERVIPEGIPDGTDVFCTHCEGRMRPRGPTGDGKARHFFHVGNFGQGGSGGGRGGGTDCESVGESDIHRKWKNLAVSRLKELFENEEWVVCAPEIRLGEEIDLPSGADVRSADALIEFQDPRPPLGKGYIIEVQYRNESKDVEAVERDYLEMGYSVFWADESHFGEDRCHLNQLTLAEECTPVWPTVLQYLSPSEYGKDRPEHDIAKTARPSGPLFMERNYMRDDGRVGSRRECFQTRAEWTRYTVRTELGVDPEILPDPQLEVRLPPEHYEQQEQWLWNWSPWSSRLNPSKAKSFLDDVVNDNPDATTIEAHLPSTVVGELRRDFWNQQPWEDRFRPSNVDEFISGVKSEVLEGTTPTGPVPFGTWATGEYGSGVACYRKQIHSAYMEGVRPSWLAESQLNRVKNKVLRVVNYNTDNRVQGNTIPEHTIISTVTRAGESPKAIRFAISKLIALDALVEDGSGYRLAEGVALKD